jgi:class 3 adenylate cyclase
MLRYLRRHLGFLAGLLIVAFALGISYRYVFDPLEQRTLPNYIRSGIHAIGIALSGWTTTMAFAALPRSRLGRVLRVMPPAVEFALKALAMTAVLTIVTLGLEFVLRPLPGEQWYSRDLPRIVGLAFVVSLLFGAIFEFRRLIGGRVLGSFFLGTYHRPRLEQRIVMFLDIAGSTALAEELGEVRVHDLITRFFFDVDAPIADHDGEVHAYVGDQVIVSWLLSAAVARNARWLHCFFAVQDRIDALAPEYIREFGLVPQFRAGVHAGSVVVSECGDTRRQIAYFGDTMNVAARLCDYCKTTGDALVASAELLRNTAVPPVFTLGSRATVTLRGRQTPVEVHAIERDGMRPVLLAAGAGA